MVVTRAQRQAAAAAEPLVALNNNNKPVATTAKGNPIQDQIVNLAVAPKTTFSEKVANFFKSAKEAVVNFFSAIGNFFKSTFTSIANLFKKAEVAPVELALVAEEEAPVVEAPVVEAPFTPRRSPRLNRQ